MSLAGALEPPPGVTPNFVDPISLKKYDVWGQTVCLTVSTLAVWIRMYSKLRLIKAVGWEDYTCFIAWVGLIGYVTISFEADEYGSGIHMWNVTKQDATEYAKLANASQILYGPLIFMTKLSILLLYLRVFVPRRTSKTFFFIHLLLWTNLSFYLINTSITIFECTPRSKIWIPDSAGHCINMKWLIIVAAIINVVSDLTILMLPVASIWSLQMGTKQKLGVSAIFAAGIFGCVSSIMRLIIIVQNSNVKDLTYAQFGEFLWTSAEITSGILCSCVPALPAFFRHYYAKVASRLFKNRVRQKENSALFTYRDSSILSPVYTMNSPWNGYDTEDTQTMQRSDVELQERSYWDPWDEEEASRKGRKTSTLRGAKDSQETITLPPPVQRSMKDLLKTATVAQYPTLIATRR